MQISYLRFNSPVKENHVSWLIFQSWSKWNVVSYNSHTILNSHSKLSADKYQRQFPNSNIAKKYFFRTNKTFLDHKSWPGSGNRCLVNSLISLENQIQTKFTACFDEALNYVSHDKPMGLYLIYFDDSKQLVLWGMVAQILWNIVSLKINSTTSFWQICQNFQSFVNLNGRP